MRDIDPTLPVLSLRTLENQLDQTLLNEGLMATLASAFAALAVLLTVVGLYGVISFVAAGVAIAIPAIWGLGRMIESQLFGVRANRAPYGQAIRLPAGFLKALKSDSMTLS